MAPPWARRDATGIKTATETFHMKSPCRTWTLTNASRRVGLPTMHMQEFRWINYVDKRDHILTKNSIACLWCAICDILVCRSIVFHISSVQLVFSIWCSFDVWPRLQTCQDYWVCRQQYSPEFIICILWETCCNIYLVSFYCCYSWAKATRTHYNVIRHLTKWIQPVCRRVRDVSAEIRSANTARHRSVTSGVRIWHHRWARGVAGSALTSSTTSTVHYILRASRKM